MIKYNQTFHINFNKMRKLEVKDQNIQCMLYIQKYASTFFPERVYERSMIFIKFKS